MATETRENNSDEILKKYIQNTDNCNPQSEAEIQEIKKALLQLAKIRIKNKKCRETLKNESAPLTKAINVLDKVDKDLINEFIGDAVSNPPSSSDSKPETVPGAPETVDSDTETDDDNTGKGDISDAEILNTYKDNHEMFAFIYSFLQLSVQRDKYKDSKSTGKVLLKDFYTHLQTGYKKSKSYESDTSLDDEKKREIIMKVFEKNFPEMKTDYRKGFDELIVGLSASLISVVSTDLNSIKSSALNTKLIEKLIYIIVVEHFIGNSEFLSFANEYEKISREILKAYVTETNTFNDTNIRELSKTITFKELGNIVKYLEKRRGNKSENFEKVVEFDKFENSLLILKGGEKDKLQDAKNEKSLKKFFGTSIGNNFFNWFVDNWEVVTGDIKWPDSHRGVRGESLPSALTGLDGKVGRTGGDMNFIKNNIFSLSLIHKFVKIRNTDSSSSDNATFKINIIELSQNNNNVILEGINKIIDALKKIAGDDAKTAETKEKKAKREASEKEVIQKITDLKSSLVEAENVQPSNYVEEQKKYDEIKELITKNDTLFRDTTADGYDEARLKRFDELKTLMVPLQKSFDERISEFTGEKTDIYGNIISKLITYIDTAEEWHKRDSSVMKMKKKAYKENPFIINKGGRDRAYFNLKYTDIYEDLSGATAGALLRYRIKGDNFDFETDLNKIQEYRGYPLIKIGQPNAGMGASVSSRKDNPELKSIKVMLNEHNIKSFEDPDEFKKASQTAIREYVNMKFDNTVYKIEARDKRVTNLTKLVTEIINRLLEPDAKKGGSKTRKKLNKKTKRNKNKKHKKSSKKSSKKYNRFVKKKYTKKNKKYQNVRKSLKKSSYKKKRKFSSKRR